MGHPYVYGIGYCSICIQDIPYVTGPRKTGLIYTKYTCSYYATYLLFCMCYPKAISFIELFMDFCIYGSYDDILDTIWITDKKLLLHFKLSKSGQVLRLVFPGLVTNVCRTSHTHMDQYRHIGQSIAM